MILKLLCNGYSCFTDESDRDTQFGDDEEDYDLFSRLEESRAELEGELGCDRFLKVYKTVQVSLVNKDPHLSILILIWFLAMKITIVIWYFGIIASKLKLIAKKNFPGKKINKLDLVIFLLCWQTIQPFAVRYIFRLFKKMRMRT